MRGRKYDEEPSGDAAIFEYAMVNFADSAATTRSPARARLMPPPAATPLTAMITGLTVRARRDTAPWRYVVSSLITTPMRSALSLNPLTSPPHHKAFPAPVTTIQRTARSPSASRVAWNRAPPRARFKAL